MHRAFVAVKHCPLQRGRPCDTVRVHGRDRRPYSAVRRARCRRRKPSHEGAGSLRHLVLPARARAHHHQRPRRNRHARHHADGRRQVAVLPAPRARAARHHAGGVAAHRAHEGSVRQARGARRRGAAARLHAGPARGACRARPAHGAAPVHRLRHARAAGRRRFPLVAGAGQGRPLRGRRGALHLAVGARFPPRLPRPGSGHRRDRSSDCPGADRHRAAAGQGRHPRAARRARRRRRRRRPAPAQPPLPRDPGVDRAQEARRPRPPPREVPGLRHHLRRHREERRVHRDLPR